MRCIRILFLLTLILLPGSLAGQKKYGVTSPDGHLAVTVSVSGELTWELAFQDQVLVEASPLSLDTDWGILGKGMRVRKIVKAGEKGEYAQLTLVGRDGYDVEFRVYNEGAAYRFASRLPRALTVNAETAVFRVGKDRSAFIPYVRKTGDFQVQFFNTFENTYAHTPLSAWEEGRLAFLPLMVEYPGGVKLCITESDLEHYPGMYLYPGADGLEGVFAPYPARERQGSHDPQVTVGGHNMVVTARENWIARVPEGGVMPWRVVAVCAQDKDMLVNDLVYRLARPSQLEDASWIKPGMVAWEWLSDRNLTGVDFLAGVNTDTYKYYIDFAAANHIPYVVLDDGWYSAMEGSAFAVVPEINLPELIAYGEEKGVGLMLWVGYYVFQKDMERIISEYAAMGIKGFKLDAIGRDDQKMNEFYYRSAALAAQHHVVLDFHGGAKPAGLNRTWPNVLNFEGVHGLEQLKNPSYSCDLVTYDVTFPFIRGIAGPVDYTQGLMRNATRESFRQIWSNPMSQGTRCRQLAEYVVFDSPLNMLCDTPSHYMQEQECTDFITAIPTVWQASLALEGKIGEYITLAREGKDGTWYVGGLTSWTPRDTSLELSFLPEGKYQATVFEDGINAHRNAEDYRTRQVEVDAADTLQLHLAPGGGFVIKLERL
ncbi:MAG TPA: Retaining alpha-galactosidase [Rikenellaceae bacterium]|nr:Retaining alpha-galactosidase [Rikenellaceae bacterium]